jgi:hypothetical protein
VSGAGEALVSLGPGDVESGGTTRVVPADVSRVVCSSLRAQGAPQRGTEAAEFATAAPPHTISMRTDFVSLIPGPRPGAEIVTVSS